MLIIPDFTLCLQCGACITTVGSFHLRCPGRILGNTWMFSSAQTSTGCLPCQVSNTCIGLTMSAAWRMDIFQKDALSYGELASDARQPSGS
ncbi:hypothetical protein LSAT2_006140 [Lamellibrachia satsuma]|nr:hypothetical protein LSAT2_006140 [Lamellibrachia satsuma]